MAQPTLKFFRVQDDPFNAGGTHPNSIVYMNNGGVVTEEVGTGAAVTVFDFEDAQAGLWSKPNILIFQFDANTASDMTFRLYDYQSNLEDFFPGAGAQWDFRIKLSGTLYDPTNVAALIAGLGDYSTWPTLPHGASTAGYAFDTNLPNPLAHIDDGHGGYPLLIRDAAVTTRWRTNFFTYVVAKPESNAEAGEHLNWSCRTTYNYPG